MDSSTVASGLQVGQILLFQILTPILVALAAYICTWQLGEWKNRRRYSKLGVSIMEMLQEELNSGISIMEAVEKAVNDSSNTQQPSTFTLSLPTKTWSGPQTIPDEVLLRIIETCGAKVNNLPPASTCRIHCKNYFDHMCTNYNNALSQAMEQGADWKQPFLAPGFLGRPNGTYLHDARFVRDLLSRAREQFEANAKRCFPR